MATQVIDTRKGDSTLEMIAAPPRTAFSPLLRRDGMASGRVVISKHNDHAVGLKPVDTGIASKYKLHAQLGKAVATGLMEQRTLLRCVRSPILLHKKNQKMVPDDGHLTPLPTGFAEQ